MKRKLHGQIQPHDVLRRGAQVRQEIQNFFLALDSYPARAAKEPRISFQQHLCSVSTVRNGCRVKRIGGRQG